MSFQKLTSAQTKELSHLVELEAGWENLRVYPPTTQHGATLKELQQKQKAYEAFHAKLMAYNKEYRPVHVAELLLNTADRLGAWCRRMTDLHLAVQQVSQAYYPIHLLEKAYRWADRLSEKLKIDCISRPTTARDTAAAIRELEDLARWCEKLVPQKLAG